MKYFQLLYPNNTIAIVAPCVASDQEKVRELLNLIQSRTVTDPYAMDLMTKLASMLPRCDVPQKGFKLYCEVGFECVPLPKETLEAIFYKATQEVIDDNGVVRVEVVPCLITQIHTLKQHNDKPSDKLPLKLSNNMVANLVSQLVVMSHSTGCNATDLIHQYSLSDLDDIIRDFSERVRPYDDRVEERLQEMWESDHAEKFADPEFLFNLSLSNGN
jgi:hypothetical protein